MSESFLMKLQTLVQVFFCEFCEISKNTFFTGHIWSTASVGYKKYNSIIDPLTIILRTKKC